MPCTRTNFAVKIKQLIDLRPGKAKRPARMILVSNFHLLIRRIETHARGSSICLTLFAVYPVSSTRFSLVQAGSQAIAEEGGETSPRSVVQPGGETTLRTVFFAVILPHISSRFLELLFKFSHKLMQFYFVCPSSPINRCKKNHALIKLSILISIII